MRRITLVVLCVLATHFSFAQTTPDYKELAKGDLTSLKSDYDQSDATLTVEQDTLKVMAARLDPNLEAQRVIVVNQWKKRDTIYMQSKTSWDFYASKGVSKDSLNAYFTLPDPYLNYEQRAEEPDEEPEEEPEEEVEIQNYLYFGDDNLVLETDFIKDENISNIFKSILNDDRVLNLGDFWFPKDEQEIPVSIREKVEKTETYTASNGETKTRKYKVWESTDTRYLKFDKIELELYEGSLEDIKVYLKNDRGVVYLFENTRSLSLLRFTKTSQNFYLTNRSQQTFRDEAEDHSQYMLRLSDVLRYFNSPGKNFVPDNQNLVFPIMISDEDAEDEENENPQKRSNRDASNIYELQQTTALENVLDLRAYTDFLGVFGDAENGIASFEGDATFFVNPFKGRITNIFWFKKIRPYVSVARLDDDNRFLQLEPVMGSDDGERMLTNRISQLQQSYLDLGISLDLLSYKFSKEMPFEAIFYGVLRYQVAEIEVEGADNEDYKSLGIGGGLMLDFRRFDNFSFRYSAEFAKYNQDQYNNIPGIIDPDDFWVFRNEAEVAYFAGGSKRNAIFVRLKHFDDFSDGFGDNFFQFQFGYRFGIGVQKVKSKN